MTMQEFSRQVAQNASNNGDQPRLAREGNSNADRRLESVRLFVAFPPDEEFRKQRKLEESKPRRFQEDDELYEEKASNQRNFAKKLEMGLEMEAEMTTTTNY